jgi:hypothetical protein
VCVVAFVVVVVSLLLLLVVVVVMVLFRTEISIPASRTMDIVSHSWG